MDKKYASLDWTDLSDFYRPVKETEVFVSDEGFLRGMPGYKGVAYADNGEPISVMGRDYNIVSNKELIEPILDNITKWTDDWYIDPESFLSNERMRMRVVFPELKVVDKDSEIPLCMYIHNSYDGSEGIRITYGGIRSICTNGMVFGNLFNRFYRKHTKGYEFDPFLSDYREIESKIPIIQNRIKLAEQQFFSEPLAENVYKELGANVAKEAGVIYNKETKRYEYPLVTVWTVVNLITNYVSHRMPNKHMIGTYEDKISKVFQI